MIALEGLCFAASYRSTFRASMFVTVATKINSFARHGTEWSTGPGDVHPAPMFFHQSPSKSSWSYRVHCVPSGSHRVPPGSTRVPFLGPGPTPRFGSKI